MMVDDKIKQINCGRAHTLLLKSNGELLVCGRGANGQIGLGNKESKNKPTLLLIDEKITKISCGLDHSVILNADGEVWVMGGNQFGQLGTKQQQSQLKPISLMKEEKLTEIFCGYNFSILYKEDGEILGFGSNSMGGLGIGEEIKRQFTPISLLYEENISIVMGKKIKRSWKPEKHYIFPTLFKKCVLIFVLYLQRLHTNTGLKIPKFIRFEIIKQISL